ncbi:uncharacterized protein LOC113214814 isoform X2 [Frankliniella occidentalis]|uniref:Uncharacterized protein LOC113214814 isoform X2 n=1 Tax=Frankliniella occidentalis TaxID=133901 RepID=A0A6J1T9W8_FRAOC|nr:uncharacterized protein LOC113214814 isoform X2 [Frankliniella occidentalis]
MAALKMCLFLAASAAVLLQPEPASAGHASKAPGSGKGARFFKWASEQLPEVSLKLVSCVKKNDKEVRESLGNMFSDVGRCFDEAKGSVLSTSECLLANGVPHMQGALGVTHRVLACAFQKQKSEFRLCLSATTAGDESCPLAVGL